MKYKTMILAGMLGAVAAGLRQEPTPPPTPEATPQTTPRPRPIGTPRANRTPEAPATPAPTPESRDPRTPGIGKFDPMRTPGVSRTPGGDPGDKIVPPPGPERILTPTPH